MVAYIPESNSFSPVASAVANARDGEPVYALPDQGQNDRGEPRIFGYFFVELVDRPRRVVLGIEDAPTRHRVVPEDERAGTREPQRPLQVHRVTFLVCVYEDEVEGALAALIQLPEELPGVADPDLDLVRKPRALDVLTRHFRVALVQFQGNQEPVLRQRAPEVYGAVTT